MHFPVLIHDLAIILGVAAVVTFIFRRIKQPVVLGYIVAGIIVGPHTDPMFSVSDLPSIRVWAELGVIFLMFSLGLEFSFRRLAKVGMSAAVTAIFQIVSMMIISYGVGASLGWKTMDSIFLGCMLAISSTTIIIKALEELGLKSYRFAELVFGILIVEDLAAILMLVGLTNVASTSEVGGLDLLFSAGKLAIVVAAWIILGVFLVPRFVKSVSKHGTNETLTVVSLGLCLVLVSISAHFHYSAALGAFIMGSILAESRDVHKIEALVEPLRDIFGAVFFVSVGMLLDPKAIIENWQAVLIITLAIIVGKTLLVGAGALGTGQTLSNSVYAGLSMSQIGEFSFIIATLGLSYQVIEPEVYPIIVAASLITTFTTPYLLRASPWVSKQFLTKLPMRFLTVLDQYSSWIQNRSLNSDRDGDRILPKVGRWLANCVVVICVFEIAANQFLPLESAFLRSGAWALAFAIASPFIWGMASVFRPQKGRLWEVSRDGGRLFFSQLMTLIVIGLLSSQFFSFWAAVAITIGGGLVLFLLFRKQLESYYVWFERQFASGLKSDGPSDEQKRYAPWDMHLVEIPVSPDSPLVGQTLLQAQLREKYGINVVVMKRGKRTMIAPKAGEFIFSGDMLLCSATDAEIQKMTEDMRRSLNEGGEEEELEAYQMSRVLVKEGAPAVGQTIRSSSLHDRLDSMVVGMERDEKRIKNPLSDTRFQVGDILWVVGPDARSRQLKEFFQGLPEREPQNEKATPG